MSSSKKPSDKLDRLSNLNLKEGASERLWGPLRDLLRRGEVPNSEFSLRKQPEDNGQNS